jgi:hypothetical protein
MLVVPKTLEAFRINFQMSPSETVIEGEINFIGGQAVDSTGKQVPLREVSLSPQRLRISVNGDSQAAESAYAAFSAYLESIDLEGLWKGASPVLFTQETGCVAELEIPWRSLFDERLLHFLHSDVTTAAITPVPDATPILKRFALSFYFGFKQRPELSSYGATLADKAVTIEPRLNTPLTEKTYYTHSPTDSETHLQLLRALEKEFSKSGDVG